jgi:HAD superfamily hydrolase (TIGR01509 family)
VTVTAYEALELARNLIRNGEARETLKISGIAVSLGREQGLERDDEVRARFFEKLDARMDQTGPGNDLVRLLEQRKTRLTKRLDTWRLGDYFRCAVTPEQVAEFKPSPRPYLKAIENFHLPPIECYVVGDEPVDMLGGKRAGTRTIGLPQGFYSREELEEAGADSIITSLNALPSILFQ